MWNPGAHSEPAKQAAIFFDLLVQPAKAARWVSLRENFLRASRFIAIAIATMCH